MRAAILLLLLLLVLPAQAQTLRVGLSAETSSADPHHYGLTPNTTLRNHLFNGLTQVDAQLRVQPALAQSWERTGDRTWTFHLRPGVRFSSGEAFGAPDVVFSLCRILNNKEELVSSFSFIVRRFEAIEVKGEDTLVLRTLEPEPMLLSDLATLAILPRSLGRAGLAFDSKTACGGQGPWPVIADFNEGRAAIGTGPFKLAAYARAGIISLVRNDNHWGEKPHWAEVRLMPITAPASRLAALLAGDQDLIEAPGTADLPKLRTDQRFVVTTAPTTRLIFLQLDTARDPSPFVQGKNALQDTRVRQALSLAINRQALLDRIMDGVALPAAQFLPDGMFGTIPGLPVLPYDPARARALLAEAGYDKGFTMTLHATNNRYINDVQLAQAFVQQWQRIGVKAELELMPSAMFFPRRGKRDFSAAMGGWSTDAGETTNFFRTWLMSTDTPAGTGPSNYGGWSDPAFDTLSRQALTQMDEAKRMRLLQQAGQRALEQMPVIPIHFERAAWAARKGIAYPGRVDQTTSAAEVTVQ